MAAGLVCLAVMLHTAGLPNVVSCSAAFSACEKGQQWQRSLGILEVMRQADVLPNVIYHAAPSLPVRRASNGSRLWVFM